MSVGVAYTLKNIFFWKYGRRYSQLFVLFGVEC